MKTAFFVSVIFFPILTSVFAADIPAKKTLVGLNRFKGDQYTAVERQALTTRFQEEVLKNHTMEVLEQEKIDAIVKEYRLADAGFISSSGMVELGQRIGVSRFLIPSISRIGSIVTLDVRLIDVATGKTMMSVSLDTRHSFGKILASDIRVLARKIAGSDKTAKNALTFDMNLKRKPVAVLDISGYGINSNETKGLTNRLRGELFNTGQYEVMEREQMDLLLKEQGLQQSGICQDENCMAKAGQMIGVKYMLGGAVSRIGSMYSVSSRLIDVESGKIVRSATADVNGNLEKVLKNTMNDMARAIAGLPVHQRVSYPALAWAGSTVGLALGGAYYSRRGNQTFLSYSNEQYDLVRLKNYKLQSKQDYLYSYGFYSLAAITAGLSVYVAIRDRVKLHIDQVSVSPLTGPGSTGVTLSLDF